MRRSSVRTIPLYNGRPWIAKIRARVRTEQAHFSPRIMQPGLSNEVDFLESTWPFPPRQHLFVIGSLVHYGRDHGRSLHQIFRNGVIMTVHARVTCSRTVVERI